MRPIRRFVGATVAAGTISVAAFTGPAAAEQSTTQQEDPLVVEEQGPMALLCRQASQQLSVVPFAGPVLADSLMSVCGGPPSDDEE
jgi:hypothetical protein